MVKGGDQLARGRIPELGGVSPLAVRIRVPSGLNAASIDTILMVKGGDQLARGRIPEFGGFVPACRQDPSAVRAKRRVLRPHPDGQRRPISLPEAASQSLAL